MGDFFVGQAELFTAKQQRGARGAQMAAKEPAGALQPVERLVRGAVSQSRGTHHERTIGHGFCDAREHAGRSQQVLRADAGDGLAEGDFIRVDEPQVEESEVRHGAGGGADVQGISSIDKHHGQTLDGSRIQIVLHYHQNPILACTGNIGTFRGPAGNCQ